MEEKKSQINLQGATPMAWGQWEKATKNTCHSSLGSSNDNINMLKATNQSIMICIIMPVSRKYTG